MREGKAFVFICKKCASCRDEITRKSLPGYISYRFLIYLSAVMAYNELTVKRIAKLLREVKAEFEEKKMFSGVCFMVDGKMCCGTHIDKKSDEEFLLCRIGEAAYPAALNHPDVIPMEFTGKAMKGYIFVKEPGFKKVKDLAYWLKLCLDFNPFAKASKK